MSHQTRKRRCVSECKSLDRSICMKTQRCNYTDGATRKFCRLAKGFRMQRPDCKIVKTIKKKIARQQIGKFILEHKERKTTNFLKNLCSDSGACIAFGTNRAKITNFFKGFTDFQYVDPPIKSIGKPSNNGFVKEIKYKKNDYNAYAVLKSSAAADSDNLVYEYIVGEFINLQCRLYPCFLETYGLYFYKSPEKWRHVRDTQVITTNVLSDSLEFQKSINYAKMCNKSKYAAILIQHLKDVTPLVDAIETSHPKSHHIICYDLLYILYQVYMPLAQMRNNFTQYDLHAGNVLLYEPVKGKHIQYHYHIGDGKTITFNSPYIAKIIDYGRSFFKYNQKEKQAKSQRLNPEEIYKKLCEEQACNNTKSICGSTQGFEWMSGPLSNENYFISSQLPNMSHDLRLLDDITSEVKDNKPKHKTSSPSEKAMYKTITTQVLDKVEYGHGIKGDEKGYGTNVNKKLGFPNSINNVIDAERTLREIIVNDPLASLLNEQKYPPENKIGDIHVYNDGSPMHYEPI